ncbi:uncharacterized protein [Argopecten irradians]|uniref:uncharacterized protein n=1 Tax=Argopecten irradians TaxID=31199 RepID=UPI0037232518
MSLSSGNDFVSYVFEISYIIHNTQDRLAVCGSIEELGSWRLDGAAVAKELPPKSGTWFAAAELPKKSEFSWKWVVINEHNDALRWEERPPRQHRTGVCHGRLLTAWNGGETLSIPQNQKFRHIGIDDTGDETEEEHSVTPSPDISALSKENDMFASERHCPPESSLLTHVNTISTNPDNVSAQEAIRLETSTDTTKPVIETSGKCGDKPSLNPSRIISACISSILEFCKTLIEINYS